MALKSGSIISVNEFLSADDYIESPNRLFYALMQDDWNFVVYRGTVDDPRGRCGPRCRPGGHMASVLPSCSTMGTSLCTRVRR